MDTTIKALAWYTAIVVVISTLVVVGAIGPSSGYTPLIGVFAIILNTPIVVMAILVLIRMRRKD